MAETKRLRSNKPRRWARNVAIVMAALGLLRLFVPDGADGRFQASGAVGFFVISVVFWVLAYRRRPRVDEGESREWTDSDNKEFKRLMDDQRHQRGF
jgi:drug/metabolite transporter superfamily protein YnfA